ncbi:MAG: hypothetical protein EOM73_17105 [Bacteroidia bacterium]|nr:hypothetical protein [Bacteroidia bacterium]
MEIKGTKTIGAMVENHQLFGILETTWNTAHATRFFHIFAPTAMAAWNGTDFKERLWWLDMSAHLRQIGYDMDIESYEKTGCSMNQVLTATCGG